MKQSARRAREVRFVRRILRKRSQRARSAICKQRERENLTLTGNSRGSFFMEKIQVLSADVQACLKNSEKGVDKRLLVY